MERMKEQMGNDLTTDEFDALRQIAQGGGSGGRPSACVSRNAKRLTGLKYIAHTRDGRLELTEKGRQVVFIQNCIDGLRAVAADPSTPLSRDVATFLGKKGHIAAGTETAFEITQKGRECLADIDARLP